jgi:threonine dehydrogenase-like Zn-dependent dehydrogenase
MKAAYVKAPYQFQIRDVALRDLGEDEAIVKVKACGVCGTDVSTAATEATDWQPFGHEIAGVVETVGRRVHNVKVGDTVVLESGTFDRYCANCRNGRVDLCNTGPNYWLKGPMGFAESVLVPKECLVPFTGMSFKEAALIEPLGVALDLVYAADIKINDDVLVIGLGPIGLMALRLARACGARKIYAAELSAAKRRIDLAKAFGADEIILTDQVNLVEYPYARKGVERVLVTAPPRLIPPALKVTNVGGILAFIGIEYGPNAAITFDANEFHFKKLQLRASFASPALYFPRCIELVQSGVIDAQSMVSHTFALADIAVAMTTLRDDRATTVKAVMLGD